MGALTVPDTRSGGPGRSPRRHWPRARIAVAAVVGLLAAFVLVTIVALVVFHVREGRPVPAFPSLAAHPDSSLQGTVAYTAGPSRCVRIVAAAGSPSRDVLCLGAWMPNPAAATVGKEMNAPQLVWRSDGRLEITMFLMPVGPSTKAGPPAYKAEWQKVVDVRTGKVEDVPTAQLPASPNLASRPTTSPSGQILGWQSDEMTGQVTVTLTDSGRSRTLMSAHGPGEYSYRIYSAFWAPNWQWIAVDDGRILVVTPTEPSTTRVLVDGAGGFGDFPTFAVTAQNILTGPG